MYKFYPALIASAGILIKLSNLILEPKKSVVGRQSIKSKFFPDSFIMLYRSVQLRNFETGALANALALI